LEKNIGIGGSGGGVGGGQHGLWCGEERSKWLLQIASHDAPGDKEGFFFLTIGVTQWEHT
jgi:hypothetical protein